MKKRNLMRGLAAGVAAVMLAGCSAGGGTQATNQEAGTTVSVEKTSDSMEAEETKEDSTSKGKTLTMAMVSAWDSVIPFDTTSSYSDTILDLLYDKLVYLKADGTYYSRLADSWEMNEDSTVLTLKLNEKAKWHDGKPVTAHDVVFTSKLYCAPTMAAPRANNLSPFAGHGESDDSLEVKALDDHTVQFTCKDSTNIDFIMFIKFRDLYILPSHILGGVPLEEIRSNPYWENPIGSGPCIYESQISGERMEFKANKDYYLGVPDWDRFVVRVVTTSNLLSGLMNGEIDVLAGNVASLQLSDWEMAKQQPNLNCVSTASLGYQYMAVNTSRDYLPAKVRQAINMAINRSLIVDGLLQGEGEAASGPLAKSHKYYNPEIAVTYDPEGAKVLLEEAGWDGSHELILSIPTGNAIREQAAVIIQQNLAEVGINVKIETADFATHLNRVRAGDYDLGLIGSGGSPDPSECVINFNPDHLNNFSHLSDWTIYNTGAEGEHAFTFEDRKVFYDDYQVLLKDQVPFVFLYFQNSLFASNTRVTDITDTQDYSQLNRNVWNWKIQ